MTIKDIDKQTLSELIRGYEERIAELRGDRMACEMCEDGTHNKYTIIESRDTDTIDSYCPFCGRRLNRESE